MNGFVVPSRRLSPTVLLTLSTCTVAAVLLVSGVVSSSAKAAAGQKKLVIYSVATRAQYFNHEDDRERAVGENPFKTDTGKLAQKETGKGPFAGDDTLYSFDLYLTPTLKKKAGTAIYTCHYNFKKVAYCTAYFQLNSGSTLYASGPVDFNAARFTLALTGGTAKYFGANGEVAMAPLGHVTNAQRLDFKLLA